MSDKFVPLSCKSCGAKLEVYSDMERFACGYCGTEMIVQRRGGTVALKGVTEAIQRVQVGTDKTAAELALVRLADEKKELEVKLGRLRADNTKEFTLGCGGVLLCFGLLSAVIALGRSEGLSAESGIGVPVAAMVVIGGLMLTWGWEQSNDEPIKAAEKALDTVNRQIAAQREIVNCM